MDVPQGAVEVVDLEAGPALFEQGVEPVLAAGGDSVPGLDGAIPVAGRVVDAGERQPGQISEAAFLAGEEQLIFELLDDLPEHPDGGLGVALADVGDAGEETRVVEVSTLGPHFQEKSSGGGELALGVPVTAHEVEELEVEIPGVGGVELAEHLEGVSVVSGQPDDPGGLGQLARELGEPLEGCPEVGVHPSLLDDLFEDGEGGLVEPQVEEALPQEELGLLDVGRSVTGVTLDHALELDGPFAVRLLLVEAQRIGQGLARRPFGGRGRGTSARFFGGEDHVLTGSDRSARQQDHNRDNREMTPHDAPFFAVAAPARRAAGAGGGHRPCDFASTAWSRRGERDKDFGHLPSNSLVFY